jgi:hypothetical protein
MLATMAAIVTCSFATFQGVSLVTTTWRGIVAFGMVWAFQWSLLTAWEILGDEIPTPQRARAHQDGA